MTIGDALLWEVTEQLNNLCAFFTNVTMLIAIYDSKFVTQTFPHLSTWWNKVTAPVSPALPLSVFLYRSSLEFSVFILTWVGINTPVTREQLPSDQITSSIMQAPLCGFGTQRLRPPAGGFSQCYFGTRSESEWLTGEQKHDNYGEGGADWRGTISERLM